MTSFSREREVAVEAAREAGAAILRHYRGAVEAREKGRDSPVTAADLEADAIIRRRIAAAFPEDGWLSEETADSSERLGKPRVWIVDPLDGTKEFIQHIPEFCVCIALVAEQRPVVAVEYNPAADRLYVAIRGEGTTVNGTRARVSQTARLAEAAVLASRSEDKRGEWDAFKPRCRVALTGSVAFKLAELASGRGDATFTLTPKNEWDICAGTLLVEEAGGRVTDLDGAPLVFNQPSPLRPGMVASNGRLHGAVLTMIGEVTGRAPGVTATPAAAAPPRPAPGSRS
jgi:myo-inositol-1(or 4)-monophosphatase